MKIYNDTIISLEGEDHICVTPHAHNSSVSLHHGGYGNVPGFSINFTIAHRALVQQLLEALDGFMVPSDQETLTLDLDPVVNVEGCVEPVYQEYLATLCAALKEQQ